MSPLTQGRGLKFAGLAAAIGPLVAPHAGAWIEILTKPYRTLIKWSPLTQGRGLKYILLPP